MGGLVIDIIVEYLFRAIRLMLERHVARSNNWPIAEAIVVSAVKDPPGMGCDRTRVKYAYKYEGTKYQSTETRPFMGWNSAQQYADWIQSGSILYVRLNPNNPERTVVLDEDQVDVPVSKVFKTLDK